VALVTLADRVSAGGFVSRWPRKPPAESPPTSISMAPRRHWSRQWSRPGGVFSVEVRLAKNAPDGEGVINNIVSSFSPPATRPTSRPATPSRWTAGRSSA